MRRALWVERRGLMKANLYSTAARESAILTQRTWGQPGASHFISTKKLQEAVPAVEERGPTEPTGHLLETRECPCCDITPHILRTPVHDTWWHPGTQKSPLLLPDLDGGSRRPVWRVSIALLYWTNCGLTVVTNELAVNYFMPMQSMSVFLSSS